MINAILFDMDGTLIDCAELHRVSLDLALKPHGFEITDEMHRNQYNGLPTMKKLEMLGVPEGLREQINMHKQRLFIEIATRCCHPVLKNVEAVRMLHEGGFKVAVCSNSIRQSVDLLLGLTGYAPYLDLTLSNQDVSRPKPAPDIYLLAMEKLHVSPERTLIVEDNFHGVQAAKAAGAHVLKVSSPEEITIDNLQAAIQRITMERSA